MATDGATSAAVQSAAAFAFVLLASLLLTMQAHAQDSPVLAPPGSVVCPFGRQFPANASCYCWRAPAPRYVCRAFDDNLPSNFCDGTNGRPVLDGSEQFCALESDRFYPRSATQFRRNDFNVRKDTLEALCVAQNADYDFADVNKSSSDACCPEYTVDDYCTLAARPGMPWNATGLRCTTDADCNVEANIVALPHDVQLVTNVTDVNGDDVPGKSVLQTSFALPSYDDCLRCHSEAYCSCERVANVASSCPSGYCMRVANSTLFSCLTDPNYADGASNIPPQECGCAELDENNRPILVTAPPNAAELDMFVYPNGTTPLLIASCNRSVVNEYIRQSNGYRCEFGADEKAAPSGECRFRDDPPPTPEPTPEPEPIASFRCEAQAQARLVFCNNKCRESSDECVIDFCPSYACYPKTSDAVPECWWQNHTIPCSRSSVGECELSERCWNGQCAQATVGEVGSCPPVPRCDPLHRRCSDGTCVYHDRACPEPLVEIEPCNRGEVRCPDLKCAPGTKQSNSCNGYHGCFPDEIECPGGRCATTIDECTANCPVFNETGLPIQSYACWNLLCYTDPTACPLPPYTWHVLPLTQRVPALAARVIGAFINVTALDRTAGDSGFIGNVTLLKGLRFVDSGFVSIIPQASSVFRRWSAYETWGGVPDGAAREFHFNVYSAVVGVQFDELPLNEGIVQIELHGSFPADSPHTAAEQQDIDLCLGSLDPDTGAWDCVAQDSRNLGVTYEDPGPPFRRKFDQLPEGLSNLFNRFLGNVSTSLFAQQIDESTSVSRVRYFALIRDNKVPYTERKIETVGGGLFWIFFILVSIGLTLFVANRKK